MLKKHLLSVPTLVALAKLEDKLPRGIVGGVRNDAADPAKLLAEVKDVLNKVTTDVKAVAEQALKEAKASGDVAGETKAKADELLKTQAELRKAHSDLVNQLGGMTEAIKDLSQRMHEAPSGGSIRVKTVGEQVVASDAFKRFVNEQGGRGTVRMTVQNAITSVTGSAGDLIQPQRAPLIELPRRRILVRDLLTQGNTTSNAIEYPVESGFTNNARVVSETTSKPESAITFTLETAPIRTIAHYIKVSRQAMDDAQQLRTLIDSRLRYGLDLAEEAEILNGDGTGQHMNGIVTQATAYSAEFVPDSPTIIDTLRLAILQVELADYPADGIVLHPTDWARIELTKDANALYVMANPAGRLTPTLWSLPVAATKAMDEDEFLVGAFALGAAYWTRMDVEVLISSEDNDNFTKNLLTVRAEKRGTVTVYRPEAFVTGDLGNVT